MVTGRIELNIYKLDEEGNVHEMCIDCRNCKSCGDCECDYCKCEEPTSKDQTLEEALGIKINDDSVEEDFPCEDDMYHDTDKHVDEDIRDMLQLIRYFTKQGTYGEEVLKHWEDKYL